MLDFILIAGIGFLGSFGHCVGMCGPLTAAFALSSQSEARLPWGQQLRFHLLLNLGRILSYALLGAAIGGLGSVLVAGGQLAGIGSSLRRGLTLVAGSLLVWFGLVQICPGLLPRIPLLHPMARGQLHDRLNVAMMTLAEGDRWWTPAALGLVWGLIPCGFLYAAQLKAAETGELWQGAATMLAFGAGTMPTMVGLGFSASRLSRDRRSQLYRLGGWVTLSVGLLAIARTGDAMVADYSGYGSVLLLALALVARPLRVVWPSLLEYRRGLGVGAFVLASVHVLHAVAHNWDWNWQAIAFLLPAQQVGIWLGAAAFGCMMPAALTSFDRAQKALGANWRRVHLLSVPALGLVAGHCT
ncbi:MAG: sulfite exporter TauE/SafE family protein, partial [Cyanobacteria bacterium J06639_1]